MGVVAEDKAEDVVVAVGVDGGAAGVCPVVPEQAARSSKLVLRSMAAVRI